MAERQTRTATERAEQALGVAQRKRAKAHARLEAATQLQQTAKAQHEAAVAEEAYVGQNPALPEGVRSTYTQEAAPLTEEADQGGGSHLTEEEKALGLDGK